MTTAAERRFTMLHAAAVEAFAAARAASQATADVWKKLLTALATGAPASTMLALSTERQAALDAEHEARTAALNAELRARQAWLDNRR